MARTSAKCIPSVRPIELIQVWSPPAAHLAGYIEEIREKVDCEGTRGRRTEAVCAGADVLCTRTSSIVP